MASLTNSSKMCRGVLLLILASLGSRVECAVRIEVDPSPEIGRRTNVLRISCVPDDIENILYVKLLKQGAHTSNSSTQGQSDIVPEEIDQGNGRLDMTVKKPSMSNAGLYTCIMGFFNINNGLSFNNDSVTVIWKEAELSDVEADVMKIIRKVTNLEKHIKSLIGKRKTESTLRDRLAAFEDKAGNHTDKLSSLADIDNQILASLLTIETRFLNHSDDIDLLVKIAHSRTETVQETSQKLSLLKNLAASSTNQIAEKNVLQRKLSSLENAVNALEVKANGQSAFTATNKKVSGLLHNNKAYPFNDILVNVGGDFGNDSTYTAPYRGLYAFTVVASPFWKGQGVVLELQAGQQTFGHLDLKDDYMIQDQSSISTLIRLEKGANVMVKVMRFSGSNVTPIESRTVFSGYLIKPL